MVSCENQLELVNWLCERITLAPTSYIQCIGSVIGGRIKGVIGYDGYNGASIQMHVAGEPGWFTKDVLQAAFDYPFNVCEVNMIIGLVPSGNEDAIRFNTHIGFKTVSTLVGAHPDGALLLMTMERRECRYLNRNRNGQEIQSSAAA
jgi:L-amino acid N-acyltransferase YncA